MPINYKVEQGDCISSIAFEYGFYPDTIWNYPANSELKKKREDPNVLFPGDVVTIPDRRPIEFSKPTTARHKFRLKNIPAKLRLRLLTLEGQPRANEKYVLEID